MTYQEIQYARMLELRRQQIYSAYLRRRAAIPADAVSQQPNPEPEPEEPTKPGLGENVETADPAILAEAFATPSVKTVKLAGDVELTAELLVEAGSEKTVDLAGHMLSFSSSAKPSGSAVITVANGASLVVDDSNGTGCIDNSGAASKNSSCALLVGSANSDASKPAKLTINGGTFKGRDFVVSGNGNRPNTEVTITGGMFANVDGDGSAAVYQPQSGILDIAGGKFEGDCAVYVKSGKVKIADGEFSSIQKTKADYKFSSNGFKTTGDAIIVDNCGYPGGQPEVEITGGSFETRAAGASPVGSYSHGTNREALVGFVSGGKSNVEFVAATIAAGYAQTADSGKYVVAKAPATDLAETETATDSSAGEIDTETAE